MAIAALLIAQGVIFAKSSPGDLLTKYIAAAEVGDLDTLMLIGSSSNKGLPKLPAALQKEIKPPTGVAQTTLTGSSWSSQRTAEVTWPGSGVTLKLSLTSVDSWMLFFRKHNWSMTADAPTVSFTAANAAMQNGRWPVELGGTRLGKSEAAGGQLWQLWQGKFVAPPGLVTAAASWRGFASRYSQQYAIGNRNHTNIEFKVGDITLPSNAQQLAVEAADKALERCVDRESHIGGRCWAYVELDEPSFYESIEDIESSSEAGSCIAGDEPVTVSHGKATFSVSCSGTSYYSVTWMIAEFYYYPDEIESDSGSAEFTVDYLVELQPTGVNGAKVVRVTVQ